MKRWIDSELLDHLPPNDPRAVDSRRDLRRVNAWMRNAALLANELQSSANPVTSVLELGSGDGTFLLEVLRQTPIRNAVMTLLDAQNLVTESTRAGFENLGARVQSLTTDVMVWARDTAAPHFDIVVCNLFLHHFREPELQQIFAQARRSCNLFVACDPRRAPIPYLTTHLLWAIGCNEITRIDATISVRAGFIGDELSVLWGGKDWIFREREEGLFSHIFVARRRE